jgi:predicted negative regulator of RcsB-dependent stress response
MDSTTRVESEIVEEKRESSGDFRSYFTNNRNFIIGGAVLLIVAIVGIWYFRSVANEKQAQASVAVARIKPYVEANEYEKALSGDSVKKVRGQSSTNIRLPRREKARLFSQDVASMLCKK